MIVFKADSHGAGRLESVSVRAISESILMSSYDSELYRFYGTVHKISEIRHYGTVCDVS